jgi:glycosyltransferase involved in cell wall biosynthesis
MYPSAPGGIALYSYKLASALADRGVQVTVFVDDAYELDHLPAKFEKIKTLSSINAGNGSNRRSIFRILNIFGSHLYNWYTFCRYVSKYNPDILHIRPEFYFLDWLAISYLSTTGVKLVITVHDVIPHKFFTKHFSGLELGLLNYIYKRAEKLIVHSEENKMQLLRTFKIKGRRVVVIPHGEYSLPGIRENMRTRRARDLLKIDTNQKVVLFFGYIRKVKGLDILLKAFETIAQVFPDTTLVIAGSVIQGESFDEYRKMIQRMRNGRRVKCFLRYIEHHEIPAFFTAADVVVLPYLAFHSQSGVGHLAHAFAKPLIATKVGGLPELVENNRTGIMVSPGDADQLAQAMTTLLGDGRLRRDMGRRAREMATDKFSWDKIAKMTVEKAYAF